MNFASGFVHKGQRPKTAMTIAIETGQHSLVLCLLRSGYQAELERCSPLDLAIRTKRWDIVDILIEYGADPMGVDVGALLESYNTDLYERFRSMGCDFCEEHELGKALGTMAGNRPLFGFARRHRGEDPRIQHELNIALCCHAKTGNAKGVSLCLWAGADPHTRTLEPDIEAWLEQLELEVDEEEKEGSSGVEEATGEGHLKVLKLLRPDPRRDNCDRLYELAKDASIATYLLSLQPPRDLTAVLSAQARKWDGPELDEWRDKFSFRDRYSTIEAILGSELEHRLTAMSATRRMGSAFS